MHETGVLGDWCSRALLGREPETAVCDVGHELTGDNVRSDGTCRRCHQMACQQSWEARHR